MKTNSSYFVSRVEKANEEFLGMAGGVWSADSDGADGDGADGDGADGEMSFAAQDQLNASGGAQRRQGGSQDSQPYIIVVTNTNTTTTPNVEVLNANVGQFTGNAGQGLDPNGLKITYGLPNITYQQFLASISSGLVFQVGISRLIAINASPSLATAQVQETVLITTKDINGNSVSRPFIPIIDNYQFQQNQVDIRYDYLVNGLTSFIIGNIYGSTIMKVLLYPARKINQFKGLSGGNTTSYKNPRLDPALAAKK